MPTEPKPAPNWQPSFPKDNLLRYRAQSKANLYDPPSLEDAMKILEVPQQPSRPAFGWFRRRFARSAGE
jgi:hypothetical protein